MAPEYVMHGNLSIKADVYSFGVLLLEIISGQKNSNFNLDPDCQSLLDWVKIWAICIDFNENDMKFEFLINVYPTLDFCVICWHVRADSIFVGKKKWFTQP